MQKIIMDGIYVGLFLWRHKLLLDQSNIDLNARSNHGFTSFMLAKCPTGKADAVTEIFPTEELFGVVTEGVVLDFSACCGLLDLSVEVKRQADERKRLYESFADPHPNIIFGELKNQWFSQLVYQRISATNYHVTFVSSARFVEVSFQAAAILLLNFFHPISEGDKKRKI